MLKKMVKAKAGEKESAAEDMKEGAGGEASEVGKYSFMKKLKK